MTQKQRPAVRQQPEEGLLGRDGFIDSDELAEFLRVPMATLDQWASRGGGPNFHKFGRHRRYAPSDVREWIKKRKRSDDD